MKPGLLEEKEQFESSESQHSSDLSGVDHELEDEDEEDNHDVDAPRVAQWEDDEFQDVETHDLEENVDARPEQNRLTALQDDLSVLPLGALLKARRTLANAHAESDSESSQEPSEVEGDLPSHPSKKQEWSTRPRRDLEKRANKHAPIEVTSKRPVTRHRDVVEVQKVRLRDPRFHLLSGELSTQVFKSQYSFLPELHKTELSTLKDNLKRARKLLISSPHDLRQEREKEVERLELAVKTAESAVNRDRREEIEQAAMRKAQGEEKEKRKQGKGNWWMKDSDKKDLLLRARYDALEAAGGKRAIKKAIEKKKKKVGQREKRARPFGLSRGPDGGKDGDVSSKRRKLD